MQHAKGIRDQSIGKGQPVTRHCGGTRVGQSGFQGQRQQIFYRDSDMCLNAAVDAAEKASLFIDIAFFQCDLNETTYVLPAANMETFGAVCALNARDSVDKHLDANSSAVVVHEVLAGDEAHSVRNQSFEPAQSISITPEELGLTQRQGAVLVQLLEGLPNKVIARHLGLSLNTVKEHVSAILQRLDLRTRTQVISRMRHLCVRADN